MADRHPATGPDFYLGDDEGDPPHWDGRLRACYVLGRPTLAGRRSGWHVRLEPPLPGASGEPLSEVILGERSATDDLARLEDGWIQVYVGTTEEPLGAGEAPRPGSLQIAHWGVVGRSPADIPATQDPSARWARDLGRIRAFVEHHGHSRVSAAYEDDHGRLDVLVGAIRRHHRSGSVGDGGPYPGVDWVGRLEEVPGWEW